MNNMLKTGRYLIRSSRSFTSKKGLLSKTRHDSNLCKMSLPLVSCFQHLDACQTTLRFLSTKTLNHMVFQDTLPKDKFAEEILTLKTCDDILNYFGNSDQKTLNHVLLTTERIFETIYKDVWAKNDNLLANVHVAYVQLLLQSDLEKIMKPIHDHKHFQLLTKLLNDYCDMIEINKVSDVLLALIYMNIHMEDPMLLKLAARMRESIDSMDSKSLMISSHAIKSLPGLQSDLTKIAIRRLRTIMEASDSPTLEDLSYFSTTSINLKKLITTDTTKWILSRILKAVEGIKFDDDPKVLIPILRFFCLCHQDDCFLPKGYEYSSVEDECINNLHKFDLFDLQDLNRAIRLKIRDRPDWNSKIEKRAEGVFSDEMRSSDLVCASHLLSKFSSKHTIKIFQDILAAKLSDAEEKFDIVLLSNIAESLWDIPVVNDDLIRLYQKRIVENSEGIVEYISRFNRIMKFLIKYPFIDPHDEHIFVQTIVKHIERSHGLGFLTLTALGLYILTLENMSQIPHHTYSKVISSLPRWSLSMLSMLFNAFESNIKHYLKPRRQHFIELSGQIQQLIAFKLGLIPKEKSFAVVSSSLLCNAKILNSSLNHAILNLFENVSNDLDIMKTRKILKYLNLNNYYVPTLFESLVKQVIEDPSGASFAASVLRVCGKANYVPKRMNEFIDIVKDVYKNEFEMHNYKHNLTILSSLASLGFYPKEELKQFFKIEVLEALDGYVKNAENIDHGTEYNLMVLNRCVVIECPELNIPWFHEQYCLDRLNQSGLQPNRNIENFRGDVYSYLIDIFGGSKYIKRESFSPYFYKIDFECALDTNNKPISAKILDTKTQTNFQRLAMCILHERNFCRESKSFMGATQVKLRHLEMLNYKVITIPYFEWYSMGMSEKSSKIAYLEEKINNL